MTNKRLFPLLMAGAMGAALLCSAGIAKAQDSEGYYADQSETVIVRPYRYGDRIQKQQLRGTVDGERDPVALSASRSVSYGDLDLSRRSDVRELRFRVYDTARNVCRELDNYRDVDLKQGGDTDQCIRTASRDAMRQVGYPEG